MYKHLHTKNYLFTRLLQTMYTNIKFFVCVCVFVFITYVYYIYRQTLPLPFKENRFSCSIGKQSLLSCNICIIFESNDKICKLARRHHLSQITKRKIWKYAWVFHVLDILLPNKHSMYSLIICKMTRRHHLSQITHRKILNNT